MTSTIFTFSKHNSSRASSTNNRIIVMLSSATRTVRTPVKDRSRESSIVDTGGHDDRFIARHRPCVTPTLGGWRTLPLSRQQITITSTLMHSIPVYTRTGAGGKEGERCVIMINVTMSQTSEHFTLVSLQPSRPRLAKTSPTRLSHSSLEREGSYILHAKVKFSLTDRTHIGWGWKSRGARTGVSEGEIWNSVK